MYQKYVPLSRTSIKMRTHMAKHGLHEAVEAVTAYQHDERREERLASGKCDWCFYFCSSRIGGQSMTTWHCSVCAVPQQATNTATDRVCLTCARDHGLCVQCGGDVLLKVDRTDYPTPVDPDSLQDPS